MGIKNVLYILHQSCFYFYQQRRESEGVSPQNSDSYLNEDPSGTGNGSGGTLTLIVGSLFLAGILATGAFLYSRRR